MVNFNFLVCSTASLLNLLIQVVAYKWTVKGSPVSFQGLLSWNASKNEIILHDWHVPTVTW